jgi:hypothetical protein
VLNDFFRVVVGIQGQIGVGCPYTDTATCDYTKILHRNDEYKLEFFLYSQRSRSGCTPDTCNFFPRFNESGKKIVFFNAMHILIINQLLTIEPLNMMRYSPAVSHIDLGYRLGQYD